MEIKPIKNILENIESENIYSCPSCKMSAGYLKIRNKKLCINCGARK